MMASARIQSQAIRESTLLLAKSQPVALVVFGRDATDHYVVDVMPEGLNASYRSEAWRLITPGSQLWRHLNWGSIRYDWRVPGYCWIGLEVVVPHCTRTAYLEGVFGLYPIPTGIACIQRLAKVLVEIGSQCSSTESETLFHEADTVERVQALVRRIEHGEQKTSFRSTDFRDIVPMQHSRFACLRWLKAMRQLLVEIVEIASRHIRSPMR